MKRTPEQLYEYETKRIEEYKKQFYSVIYKHNLEDHKLIMNLFEWYGNARAIKSKAYQEMKANKSKI